MRVRLLVTRPAHQAGELVARLEERGIDALVVPTVAIDNESASRGLDNMLTTLEGAAWLVMTSANGAEAVASRLRATGASLPRELRVAAVGPATAAVLRAAGIRVDHVPDAYLTAAIAAGLGDVEGRRVVMARADSATPALRDALRARGANVEETVAYTIVEAPRASRDALHTALHASLDGVTFTSSSTVRGLLRLASPMDHGHARALPAYCIGPVTAATARDAGFDIAAVADIHTATGLADAVAATLTEVHNR